MITRCILGKHLHNADTEIDRQQKYSKDLGLDKVVAKQDEKCHGEMLFINNLI